MIKNTEKKLTVVIVGAHPDDCEYAAGAVTAMYKQLGHRVVYITLTNGDAGHQSIKPDKLKEIRFEESRRVAKFFNIEYEIMNVHDGCLEPNLENRFALIKLLRKYKPDLIITHPSNDYHPDHRYTSQLVADTAYMLNVPSCVPSAEIVGKDVVYCHINYKHDCDTNVTILVPADDYMDKKAMAFHLNTTQVYQWLPWTMGIDPVEIPQDEDGRLKFLRQHWDEPWSKAANNYRGKLKSDVKFIEAFTACPFGSPLTILNAADYFPFENAVIF